MAKSNIESRIGLDVPTQETRNLLNNDEIDGVWNRWQMRPRLIREKIIVKQDYKAI